MIDQLSYLQRNGNAQCKLCGFQTNPKLTSAEQDTEMMFHLDSQHPGSLTDGFYSVYMFVATLERPACANDEPVSEREKSQGIRETVTCVRAEDYSRLLAAYSELAQGRSEVAQRLKPTFMECDTCRANVGYSYLCSGCLHNREVIGRYSRRPF